MEDQQSDILDRLKHPEEDHELRQKAQHNLFVRNILNTLFIILAFITMVGIGLHLGKDDETPMWCYLLGVVAVIIKMCESLLRMPGLNKSNHLRTHRRNYR